MSKKEAVEYRHGMTKVWSDGEKVVITNETGNTAHVATNIDQIFGLGTYAEMREFSYVENREPSGRNYTLITGIVPDKVKNDLKDDNEQLNKYFK